MRSKRYLLESRTQEIMKKFFSVLCLVSLGACGDASAPLTNLQLTLLNKLGVPAEKLGDSNGEFKELSELS